MFFSCLGNLSKLEQSHPASGSAAAFHCACPPFPACSPLGHHFLVIVFGLSRCHQKCQACHFSFGMYPCSAGSNKGRHCCVLSFATLSLVVGAGRLRKRAVVIHFCACWIGIQGHRSTPSRRSCQAFPCPGYEPAYSTWPPSWGPSTPWGEWQCPSFWDSHFQGS